MPHHISRVAQDGVDGVLAGRQLALGVGRLLVLLQVGVVVESLATLVAHDVLGLQMDFVDVLRQVGVLSFAMGTLGFGSFMDNSDMLSQIAVLLSTHRAGRAVLVVDIGDVPLQISLQIAAVAAVGALEVFHL